MNRIDRLTAILIQLQSQRITRAQDIANRFAISLRTVYRDIRALEEAGVPIGSEAGVGYFLADGYRLPPIQFTPEEARALLIAGKFASQFTDVSVQKQHENALYKIKAVLKEEHQEMLDDLESKVTVLNPPNRNTETEMSPTDVHLEKIQQALLNREVVEMDYFSPGSGQFTRRGIEPIGMVYYGDAWHIIAHCQLRQDYRDFRLDRMSKLDITGQRYHLRDRLSLEQYLNRQSQTTDAVLTKIHFHSSVLRFIEQDRYRYGFMQEKTTDDGAENWFLVTEIEYFARWLLMYSTGVTVISPDHLRYTMQKLAQELIQHYSG
ncbi:helix-turn-helix transcriptional regulator [Tunicatimonas pelagia]|uniref:helix-turn-helix transcriptional regulator n=1 Tax=Tunicatimonas pelagia TaxID=931531 RepID=UPI002666EFC8|nr:YafY family protein [Tunicatimonas pelagia]WKN43901.1 YafY family protein [Tunicatimonas pelagia]